MRRYVTGMIQNVHAMFIKFYSVSIKSLTLSDFSLAAGVTAFDSSDKGFRTLIVFMRDILFLSPSHSLNSSSVFPFVISGNSFIHKLLLRIINSFYN